MAPTVKTVLGEKSPESLGNTFTHEHLSMTFEFSYRPPYENENHMIGCPWTLENSGWIQQWPYSHKDNLLMNESAEDAVFQSVQNFKKAGGGCLVENSTFGLNRRTGFLKQLSEDTGVHIVAGTGHYVADAQKDETLKRTIEEMTQHIVDELTVGAVDCPEVKCGFIGEIGCQYPVMEGTPTVQDQDS